jgi:hypothetical protein
MPIGGNDLLIADQALTLGHTIVTDHEREFARIEELPRENWLRERRGARVAPWQRGTGSGWWRDPVGKATRASA